MSSKSGREPAGNPGGDPRAGRPWSLAARLTAWYAGSAFTLILVATGFLYWALVTGFEREDDEFLADQVHILRALLRDRPGDVDALRQEAEWEWAARQYARVYLRVVDERGRVVAETPGMSEKLPPAAFPVPAAADEVPRPGAEVRTGPGKSFRAVAAWAAVGPGAGDARLIQAALDRGQEEELLAGYRKKLWLALGISLVLCTLGGHLIARHGVRPVADITAAARRVRPATLHERIGAAGLPAELADLARTFNAMLDRLEDSFARLARFSADIAHELRTPVNNLRGGAEVALQRDRPAEEYREVIGSALEEAVRLGKLIDSLLFLARAEHPETQITREPVDVGRELRGICEFYDATAAEAGVRLAVAVDDPVPALLDRPLFQRAVGNLVANALAHTPAGGTVTLSARQDADATEVEVADAGGGIPAEHLPYLFDRFYRVDAARVSNGGRVGLGLAIVKGIAELHCGSVSISSEVGRGTRVRLRFPLVPADGRLRPTPLGFAG